MKPNRGYYDGIGYFNTRGSTYPRKGDTEFQVVSEEMESEILESP